MTYPIAKAKLFTWRSDMKEGTAHPSTRGVVIAGGTKEWAGTRATL